jgi:uracil-DNA glycosylase family 4
MQGLPELHDAIDNCKVCAEFVRPLNKPEAGLDRGNGSEIFIVGQAPGNTEQTSRRAFSGISGVRLDRWLLDIGRPEGNPREGVYLTSILKCSPPPNSNSVFKMMWRNCGHFLNAQLELVRPRLVITLGRESFQYLHFVQGDYDSLIGKLFLVEEASLLPPQPFRAVVHWPHPSGLNRWHNLPGNERRMAESIAEVRQFMEVADL